MSSEIAAAAAAMGGAAAVEATGGAGAGAAATTTTGSATAIDGATATGKLCARPRPPSHDVDAATGAATGAAAGAGGRAGGGGGAGAVPAGADSTVRTPAPPPPPLPPPLPTLAVGAAPPHADPRATRAGAETAAPVVGAKGGGAWLKIPLGAALARICAVAAAAWSCQDETSEEAGGGSARAPPPPPLAVSCGGTYPLAATCWSARAQSAVRVVCEAAGTQEGRAHVRRKSSAVANTKGPPHSLHDARSQAPKPSPAVPHPGDELGQLIDVGPCPRELGSPQRPRCACLWRCKRCERSSSGRH